MKIKTKTLRCLSRPLFLVASVLTAAVLILTVAVAIGNSRARSSPYEAAEEYIDGLSVNKLYSKLDKYIRKNISEYEELPEVEYKIKELLKNGEISFARAEKYSASYPRYTVYLDGKEAFTLVLKKTFILGNAYRVKSFKISSGFALGNDVVIDVPSGAGITVNGVEIERSKSDPAPYYRLSEFEESLSDEFGCDRYALGRMFLSPDVSVVYEGRRLSASTIENGVLCFDYPAENTENYSFTVPEGAIITVNGKTVNREYASKSKVSYSFLTRFESELSGMPQSVVYNLTGLFCEPSVTVTYNGVELTEEDGAYRLPDDMTVSYIIQAPDYATVKVNGMSLSSNDITAKKKELPILSGVTGYAKQRPYLTEYTVKGLLAEPVITATDKNGNPLTVNAYYSEDGKIVFNCTSSGSPSSTVTKALTNYTKAYIKYVYSGNSGLESNYNAAIDYTPYSSLAYASLKNTYRDLYNAPQYKSISYGTLKVLEYYKYSDSAYSAIVQMTCTATLDGEKVEFTITLEILGNFSGSRRWINYKVI